MPNRSWVIDCQGWGTLEGVSFDNFAERKGTAPASQEACQTEGAPAGAAPAGIIPAVPSTAAWLKLLAVLLASYIFMMFVLTPDNSLIGFPYHHDDYDNLAYPRWPHLNEPRLVYYAVCHLFTQFGRTFTYLCLHLFTVLYPFLVLVFLAKFCRQDVSLFRMAVFALLSFATASVVEAGKSTGMTTNHLSSLFGVGALLAFELSHTRKAWAWLFVGTISFILSVFAKEDFILPILCLAVYHLASPRIAKGRALVEMACVVGVCALFLFHSSVYSVNPCTQGDTDPSAPYFIKLEFWSIAGIFRHYVGIALPNWPERIAFLIASVAWLWKGRWREYLGLTAIAASLVGPYAILPNHIYSCYATNWTCWWVGLIALAPIPFRFPRFPRAVPRVLAGALTLVVFSVMWDTQPARASACQWFSTAARKNHRIVKSLLKHRGELGTEPVVGIVGISGFSPWLKHEGQFLNQLGLTNHWVVFVPRDLPWYQAYLEPGDQVVPEKRICILSDTAIKKFPNLLCLWFDADGNITVIGRPGQWQSSSSHPN